MSQNVKLPEDIVQELFQHTKISSILSSGDNKTNKKRKLQAQFDLEIASYFKSHSRSVKVAHKLGITTSVLANEGPKDLVNWRTDYVPEHINSVIEFCDYVSSNPHREYRWISPKTLGRIFLDEETKSRKRVTAYFFLAFLGKDFNEWDEILFPIHSAENNISIDTPNWLEGVYHFYNREIIAGKQTLFQRANLILSKEENTFIYQPINQSEKITEHPVMLQQGLGNDINIIIKGGSGFEIVIQLKKKHLIKGSADPNEKLFYAHYLYHDNNQERNHSHSVLVLEKVQSQGRLLAPGRSIENIPSYIKQFLLNISLNDELPVLILKERKDNSLRASLYTFFASLKGTYFLYCNKQYKYTDVSKPDLSSNRFTSWIGKDVFIIEDGPLPNQLSCRLKSYQKHSEQKGEIIIDKRSNSRYLVGVLHPDDQSQSKFLNLIFRIQKGEKVFFGTYNTVYSSNSDLGCGLAVLVKSDNKYEDVSPILLNPVSEKADLPKEVAPSDISYQTEISSSEASIVNYLSLDHEAKLIVGKGHDLSNRSFCKFKGTYKMYSYSRYEPQFEHEKISDTSDYNRRVKSILIGALKITRFGYVEHRGDHEREYSTGVATTIGRTLFIKLVNKEKQRTGAFFFHVGDFYPKNKRIYCGVFSGVSPQSLIAIGTRIIIECCPEESFHEIHPKRINIYDSQIHREVDPRIREALMGRWRNFINFNDRGGIFGLDDLGKANDKQKERLDLGKAFYQSAIFYILFNEELKDGVKDFQRAIEHGFGNFKRFEADILEKGNQDLLRKVLDRPEYIKLKNIYAVDEFRQSLDSA